MVFTRFASYSVITLSIFILVSSAPLKQNTEHENVNQKQLSNFEKQLEDENVQELKHLKSSGGSSLSATKVQKTFYSNKNGKKEKNIHTSTQVNKNGELVERIQQNAHTQQELGAPGSKSHIETEVEIPSQGVHKLYEEDLPREMSKKKYDGAHQYNLLSNNLLQAIKMKNIVRFQPEEMAEYIYETGDENTVTTTIENYIQLGILSHEEALWYLQQIKATLNSLEQQEVRDKKQEQKHLYEALYSDSKSKMDVNQALSDLRDIQQLIQSKYTKQFPDDRRYDHNVEDTDIDEMDSYESEIRRTEYRNLAERLQNFENLFSRTSMEGVIYQLAKILFYQSFSMNGFEAQESIKQFTSFLERQVEEGHVSRSMERKVFDILLAALTDTLNEHPELISQKMSGNKMLKLKANHKNELDSLKYNTVEKNDKTNVKYSRPEKTLDLESSGIQDDPKKSVSKM